MESAKLWKEMRPPLVTSLVTTVGNDFTVNASPKSWWSPVSYDPPIVMLSVKPRSDTDRNISETGMFVLHLPYEENAQEVLHTAKPLPYGDNELDDQKIPWEWLDHERLKLRMPYIPEMPWLCCWVVSVMREHPGFLDHNVYLAQVGLSGGFGPEGVEDALLHRGRNEFVRMGSTFEVEPY